MRDTTTLANAFVLFDLCLLQMSSLSSEKWASISVLGENKNTVSHSETFCLVLIAHSRTISEVAKYVSESHSADMETCLKL
jgi:hypothetical protein